MFIRNDTEGGAYYNGKLAVVKQIHGDDVTVTFRDSGLDYLLEAALAAHELISARVAEINVTADKFQRQLNRLIEATESDPGGAQVLRERCGKAIAYFTEQIATQLIMPLRKHIEPIAYKMRRFSWRR